MRTRLIAALVLVSSIGTAALLTTGGTAGAGVDPANFDSPVRNPYFPLTPGRAYIYRGTEDSDRLVEHLRVTRRTREIEGVTTTVIKDVLFANGILAEKTTDWYSGDNDGTVWYFGERTATYNKDGTVQSREGSWLSGRDDGAAGVIMPADPVPTDAYRQEFLPAHAEDQAWIVARHERVRVPYGPVRDVVRSYEWTRLEPNVVSVKMYAPRLGIVQEQDLAGGSEFLQLVDVNHF
jgi:hypothetical protein